MPTERVFRLFISSTFGDFLEEREVLRSQVFPRLEEFCAKKGVRFQAVDLRWGITEEAQKERETIQICLEEVRRCQELSPKPNFVVLLGDRYGWEPIPEQISANHWDRIINELRGQNATEALEIIDSAYRRDENASPPVYCLKPREGAWEDGEKKDTEIQKALRMATASFDGYDRLPYFASATHQEIAMGALAVPDADKHVQVYIRHIKHLDLPNGKAFVDWDENLKARVPGAADRLNKLEKVIRQRLASDNVHTMRCRWHRRHKRPSRHHLRKFANDFYRHQVRLISEELEAHEQETAENKVNKHRLFAEERSKSFVGRLLEIDQICSYLDRREEPASPLIISGDGGIGKTSLLARSFLQAADQTFTQQAPVTIAKFIGGVVGIETLDSLLQSIIFSISSSYEMDSVQPTDDLEDTIKEFTNKLSLASGSKPIWLFIDALDQLDKENNPPLSHWLPAVLPDNVRVVISTRPETLTHGLAGLQGYTQLQLDKMSRVDGETLLNEWLSQSRATKNNVDLLPSSERTLTAEQRNVVLNTFESNGNPLWLRLACEEARRWRSWDRINTKALPETVREMTKNFIQEYLLKKRKHAEIYTHRALSYIAASRYGLSEDEIAIALGKDSSVRKEFESSERTPVKWQNQEALPPIIWSRLFLDLRPYLTSAYIDGALVYRFFHREFQEVAAKIAASETEIHQIHAHLAQVFSRPYGADLYKLTDASKPTQDSRALRRIMEQPWQLAKAERTEELQKLLTDFSFCMAKCAANRTKDLISDFRMVEVTRSRFSTEWQHFYGFFVGSSATTLAKGTQAWPAHRILLQLSLEHAELSPVTLKAEHFLNAEDFDWLVAFRNKRPRIVAPSACEAILRDSKDLSPVINVYPYQDSRILSLHNDRYLKLWNVKNGEIVKRWPHVSYFSYTKTGECFFIDRAGNINILSGDDLIRTKKLDCINSSTSFVDLSEDYFSLSLRSSHLIINKTDFNVVTEVEVTGNKVTDLKLLPNGNLLLLLDRSKIGIWDFSSRKLTREFLPTENPDYVLEIADFGEVDGYIYSLSQEHLDIWFEGTGNRAHLIQTPYWIRKVIPFTKGQICYIGALQFPDIEEVTLLDLADGKENHLHTSTLGTADIYHINERIICIENDTGISLYGINGLRIQDISTKKTNGKIVVHQEKSAFYINEKSIESVDLDTGENKGKLNGHRERIEGLLLSKNGKLLSWSTEGEIRIWNKNSKRDFITTLGHTTDLKSLELLKNGTILSRSIDNNTILWKQIDLEPINHGTLRNVGTIKENLDHKNCTFDFWVANDNAIEFREGTNGELIKKIKTPKNFPTNLGAEWPRYINGLGLCTAVFNQFSWINLKTFEEKRIFFDPDCDHIDNVHHIGNGIVAFIYSCTTRNISGYEHKFQILSVQNSYLDTCLDMEIFQRKSQELKYKNLNNILIFFEDGQKIEVLESHPDGVAHKSFRSHNDKISDFITLDNERILSWDIKGNVRIWCPYSLKEYFSIKLELSGISGIQVWKSALGAAWTTRGKLAVFNFETNEIIFTYDYLKPGIDDLIFTSPDLILCHLKDHSLKLINTADGEIRGTSYRYKGEKISIASLKNEYTLITSKNFIDIYDQKSSEFKSRLFSSSNFDVIFPENNQGPIVFSGSPECFPSYIGFQEPKE